MPSVNWRVAKSRRNVRRHIANSMFCFNKLGERGQFRNSVDSSTATTKKNGSVLKSKPASGTGKKSQTNWIEEMNPLELTRHANRLEQVYLIERDAGLLCRILGLYAARGVDVLGVDYAYAAQDVMKLQVSVAARLAETEELVRVLVDKASTLVGVLAASEHVAVDRRAA